MLSHVLLITGCASGFGLRIAITAARAGHIVYAGVRDISRAEKLIDAGRTLPIHVLPLDITDAQQRAAAVATIRQQHGRLDMLVNNAGQALGGFLELVEEDELRELFEVNVFGTWALTRHALPLLRESASPKVVMVSSTSGQLAIPGLGAYAATKFALEGMSEAWCHELALVGVRMMVIEPGAYRTDIFGRNRRLSRGLQNAGPYAPWVDRLLERFDTIVDRIARDPQEVADVIVALLHRRRTPFRITLGPSSFVRSILRRLVPFGWVEWGIHRFLVRLRAPDESQKP